VGGDLYSVVAYGAAPVAGAPVFNAGNGVLLSPGSNYGTLGATVGNSQADTGGVNAPAGNLAGGLSTAATGATIPGGNAFFGTASLSYAANNGGIFWPGYSITDPLADNNFSVSDSRGRATYVSNVVINNGQAGVVFGVSGFLPPGTQGFASLSGTFVDTAVGGVVKQQATDAVVIAAENNGSGLPNFVQNVAVGGAVNNGVAVNSRTFYLQTIDAFGNLRFTAYGIALLPAINYAVGDTLTLDGTMTLAVDPPIDFEIFSIPLDPLNTFPLIGFSGPIVPEPSSLVMGCTAIALGLGLTWLRRWKAA
jgi:hypothetical protein